MDWNSMDDDERAELAERMEERVAVELTTESQESLKQAYLSPNPEWQVRITKSNGPAFFVNCLVPVSVHMQFCKCVLR